MSGARRRLIGATSLICVALCLSPTSPDAMSQEPEPPPENVATAEPADSGQEPVEVDQQEIVEPTATPLPSDPETGGEAEPVEAAPDVSNNAAALTDAAKQDEAEAGCVGKDPTVSPMLAVGGSVGADVDDSWSLLAFLIALGAGAIAVLAFVVRRRRSAEVGERGILELAGTVVAIASGLTGLLVQFVPGIGVRERPVPEASMAIRDVHPRITRGEFARALGLEQPSGLDKREVGNVVWLELRLTGYEGKALRLQWAALDPDHGDVLLPETAREMSVRVEADSDLQTRFQPVWVGHPETQRFRVEFRLLEGPEVREMASTGPMRALEYRYSCPE